MKEDWQIDIDETWTLFLDRDGVINRRLPGDYIKHVSEFEFLDGVLEALAICNQIFGRIVVVTNQQGIGKGLMTERGLFNVHEHMMTQVHTEGGRIDGVFYCPGLEEDNPPCRKPNTEMAFEAQEMFPEIEFEKSVIVGDSYSDMEFGQRLGMHCIFIGTSPNHESHPSLIHFAKRITSK